MSQKPWYVSLVQFIAELLTQAELKQMGAEKSVALSIPLGSAYDREAEERKQRAKVVAYMRSQLGDKYVYGAEHTPGREAEATQGDCSEYNESAFRVAGMSMPDGVINQVAFCRRVKGPPKPADLIFLRPNKNGIPHVMVCTGEGTVVHALGGVGVVEQPIEPWETHERFDCYGRHPEWMAPTEERA